MPGDGLSNITWTTIIGRCTLEWGMNSLEHGTIFQIHIGTTTDECRGSIPLTGHVITWQNTVLSAMKLIQVALN